MCVGKPPSCRSACAGTRRGGWHGQALGAAFSAALAPFLFPLYAPIWPLPLGGEAGAAGRGAGGRATQAANPLHLPRHLSGLANCSIAATAFLALYALYMAYQVLARPIQHPGAGVYHLAVLRRPSAMPVEHLPAEKGPVCAPYKEGGPKSRRTRSLRGSARKPTRQEVGAPPPSHNPGALGRCLGHAPLRPLGLARGLATHVIPTLGTWLSQGETLRRNC